MKVKYDGCVIDVDRLASGAERCAPNTDPLPRQCQTRVKGSEFQMGQVQWAGPSTVLKSTAQERPGPYSIVPGPGPSHH
jgi:hypothetical protein